jgi:hypothetical protein
MKKGEATLPLHGGKAPKWLFKRMKKLARGVGLAIVRDYGPETLLERLADPHWFQAFGCVLGFDWHSSGLTTTTCGALKEALSEEFDRIGLYICGGKGSTSRKTPDEITRINAFDTDHTSDLIYASRMSAKVDNTAVQDGYQLYHHNFICLEDGTWCVIQQGMNDDTGKARRYHWLSSSVDDFVCEPQLAVCSSSKHQRVLNMVSKDSGPARDASADLTNNHPDKLVNELIKFELPERHQISRADINPDRLHSTFTKAYENQPDDFEDLLGTRGVGPKTVRALSLLAEIIHGEPADFEDPARYSFAHGGKDGTPYPVDRDTYDRSIQFLEEMVNRSDVEYSEKKRSLKKLARMKQENESASLDHE